MDYLNAFDVIIAFCVGALFGFVISWFERKTQADVHKLQYQKLAQLCIQQDEEIVQWRKLYADRIRASTTPQPTEP